MAIARFENIAINNLTFSLTAFGEQTTTTTKWFDTRATVSAVGNNLKISEKYRLYDNLVRFRLNYTPNMQTIANAQHLFSITYRTQDWRINDVQETDDRMSVLIMAYRNDPVTAT